MSNLSTRLETMKIKLFNPASGTYCFLRALLDTGSNRSFIKKEHADAFNLPVIETTDMYISVFRKPAQKFNINIVKANFAK